MSDTAKTDAALGRDDLLKALLDGAQKGATQASQHNYDRDGDTRTFMGVELDPAFAILAETTYTALISKLTNIIKPKAYGTIKKLGTGHLEEALLHRTAGAGAFAINVGIFAMPSITRAYKLWHDQRDALDDKLNQLSTTLDDIKGKHGLSAYTGVSVSENEMIAFDRWRTMKTNHTNLTNLIVPALMKIAPNIWFSERDTLKVIKSGVDLHVAQQERIFRQIAVAHGQDIANALRDQPTKPGETPKPAVPHDEITHEQVAQVRDHPRVKQLIKQEIEKDALLKAKAEKEGLSFGGMGGILSAGGLLNLLSEKWLQSSNHKLKRTFTKPYTALDMVIALHDQLGNEPKPSTFQLPEQNGRGLPLEAYIAEIMMQHQRDMAVMNPDYAVIRDALKENVLAAAKPLAEAIRKNQIGAMSLVSYVGTGKIIRNRGRMIATADEVEAMIEHEKTRGEAKPKAAMTVDAKDFWADASYTKDEGKEAFEALHGEERQLAITFVPPNLWKDFGIGEKEGKEAIDTFGKEIETHLAEAILGINALDDDTLRKEGLAKAEIRKIREAAKAIEHKGAEAVSQLKSSESHPNGVDREVLGVVVGTAVKGDKVHLGTILKDGREQLKELKSGGERKDHRRHEAANDDEYPDRRHLKTHSEREDHRRGEAANHGHARGAVGE